MYKMDELKGYIVESMGHLFEEFGVDNILGRISGLLLVSKEPLSLQEIADQLQLSKSSISIKIRKLEDLGYCKKLPVTSDRKSYYKLNDDFLELTLINRIQKQERYILAIERMMNEVKEISDSKEIILERLDRMKRFQNLLIETSRKALDIWKEEKLK